MNHPTGAESMPENSVLTRKIFEPVESHFTPGERSMVAWISTDCVDHERDVVVASGIDFKTFFLGKTPEEGNPCVLAFHDFGRWPLGKCEWVKIKQGREFNGLYAKTIFDEDPDSEAVWKKIKSRSLRGISIGFRPPDDLKPGEWGPPTREEISKRPDWKGASRVIRRCVLLEYSVCSLPMNPQALVMAVNKGIHRPVYDKGSTPMNATLGSHVKHGEGCGEVVAIHTTGKHGDHEASEDDPVAMVETHDDKCMKTGEKVPMRAKALEMVNGTPEDETTPKCMERTKDDEDMEGTDEPDETAEAMDGDDEDPIEGSDEGAGFTRGDHVNVKAPHYKGFGVVQGVHKRGHVPHVANDVMGTEDEPAARVKCFKAMGDGHVPTEDQIGVKCAHLTRMAVPMKPPTKGKAAPATTAKQAPAAAEFEPLPPLVALSDQQIQAKAIAQINEIPALVQRELARITGVV